MSHIRNWIILTFIVQFTTLFSGDYDVLGIGAPTIDILVNVDDTFIESIGKKGGCLQIDALGIEKILKKAKKQKSYMTAGGSCSNTIRGVAAYGHSCALLGKMGQDEMGSRFLETLAKTGIKSLCIVSPAPTQVVACLIGSDGDRTMRCYPGGANDMKEEELDPEMFKGVKIVHVDGYTLYTKDPAFLPTAMRMAKEAGAAISFDLGSFELVESRREVILELIRNYIDIVFANKDEIYALFGKDPVEGCKELKELCKIAVVMVGKDGCIVGSGSTILECPTTAVKLVDTTGAGDLFASGFLHGYLSGMPLEECAKAGNRTGGAVCEVIGAEISPKAWEALNGVMSN